DLKSLEFYPSIEDVETLSFIGMYITKSPISTLLGESATMQVRFVPENVSHVEGRYLKSYYDTSSNYKRGPLSNYDLITDVPLDKLGILPGSYKVYETYSVLTGFSYRHASPEVYDITIEKDTLKSLSNERFPEPLEMGYEYGSVYTFEYQKNNKKWWNVIYDGKIVDSLNIGVQLTNLTLYLESRNKFIEVAKIDTDKEGFFYYNHSVFQSIDQNALVKIFWEGNGLYEPLEHYEYGGLERPIDGKRFFRDKDFNKIPDWPYSLYGLIKMAGIEDRHAMPFQPNNFSFSKGSFKVPYGDLEFYDFNETLIDSEFTQGVSGQGTFGYESVGGTRFRINANNKQGSKFTLTENGLITKVTIWGKLRKGGNIRIGIYSDNNGAPDILKGSEEFIMPDLMQWHEYTLTTPISLTAGDWWLVASGDDRLEMYGDTGSTDQRAYNSDTYSDGLADPFDPPLPSYSGHRLSIFATYNKTGGSNSNDVDVEIEWSVIDTVNTMDSLRWIYSTSGTATSEFYVWKDTYYELQTGGAPLNLTTDYYDETTNTIKVKFVCNDSSSSFILYIDQLRVDYTVLIPTISNDTLDFYALFDEDSGLSTFEKIHQLEGTLQGNTTWTTGLNNSALLFDGSGQPLIPGVNETRNDVPLESEFLTSNGTFNNYGSLEFDDDINNTILTSEFSPGASWQGSFGYNQIGSNSVSFGKDNKFGTKFTLTEDGSVSNLLAYMGLGGGAKIPKEAVGAIYSDNSGPDQLLAYTTATTIGADAWYTFIFSSAYNLQAGDYWLVILTGTKVDVFGENTGGSSESNSDSYSDGPTSTFGASTSGTWKYSIYANYDWSSPDSYDIIAEIEWSVNDVVASMEYLLWDYLTNTSATVDFSVWKNGAYELQTEGSPLQLTSDYYNGVTVKVKFECNSSNSFTLDIDQLRIDYNNTVGYSDYMYYDYLQWGDILDDTLSSEFVITIWIFPTAFNSNKSANDVQNVFISKDGSLEIGITDSGRLQIYLNTINVEANATYGNFGAISLNSWQFLAIRYNNSNVDVMIHDTWYYNATGLIVEPWSGGGELVNGGSFTTGAETTTFSCFTGSIDQLSVFNKSLGNLEIEDHKGMPILSLSTRVLIEDGVGGWTPITDNEVIFDSYINFEANASDNVVSSLAFYLSDSEPDIINPEPNNWSLITSYTDNRPNYNFLKDSWSLPDGTWYFIAKGVDVYNNIV
ncbi:hypothetical protein LCGC14_1533830, partial [marine sediment metagenome]